MRSLTYFALVSVAAIGLAAAPATSSAQQSGPCNPAAATPAPAPAAPHDDWHCPTPAESLVSFCQLFSCSCDNKPSDDWHCPTLGESLASFSDLVGFPCGPDAPNPQAAPCGPTWFATADAIVMQRISLNGAPLALRQSDGSTALNSQDIHFNDAAGPRLTIGHRLNSYCDVQFVYYSIDGSHGSGSASDPGGVQLSDIAPFIGGGAGTSLNFNYSSRLYNGELNLRRKIEDGPTILVGLRWLELQDGLGASLSSTLASIPVWNVDANNHLLGVQLGAEGPFWPEGGRFGLDGFVKAGVYGCHAGQVNSSPITTVTAGAETDRASFVGEAGLTAHFQVTDHILLRGGYEVLWIDGIAMAPMQVPLTDLSAGTTAINADGGVLYHGAFAGLEMNY
jgi:hypothetical protein